MIHLLSDDAQSNPVNISVGRNFYNYQARKLSYKYFNKKATILCSDDATNFYETQEVELMTRQAVRND